MGQTVYERTTRTRKTRTTRITTCDGAETIETVEEIIDTSEKISQKIRDEKNKRPTAQRDFNSLINQILGNTISHYLTNMIDHLKQLICNIFCDYDENIIST